MQAPQQQAIEKLVNTATESKDEPDWGSNMQLCDMVLTKPDETAPIIIHALRQKIQHELTQKHNRNDSIIKLSLTLWDALVKNTNDFLKLVTIKKTNIYALVQLLDDDSIEGPLKSQIDTLVEDWDKELDMVCTSGFSLLLDEVRRSPPSSSSQFQTPNTPTRSNQSLFPQHQRPPPQPFQQQPQPQQQQQQQLSIDQHLTKLSNELGITRDTIKLFNDRVSSLPSSSSDLPPDALTAFYNLKEMQKRIIILVQQIERIPLSDDMLIELIEVNDLIQQSLSSFDTFKRTGSFPSNMNKKRSPSSSPSSVDSPSHPSQLALPHVDDHVSNDPMSIDELLGNSSSSPSSSPPPPDSLAPRRPLFSTHSESSSSPSESSSSSSLPPLRKRVPQADTAQNLLDFTFDQSSVSHPQASVDPSVSDSADADDDADDDAD
eukprot:CAMPEP_0117423060 /NCGR_PEP_ID=MMETSP0758-20121206/3775_1 /TAXON_ID=63605 /ORGANISM="Percolomonas cosmopolitus, Strain AE-1 (ATCC 50343)" /LENGTH=432 /DNA_ID=CAMNT_0005206053 /DNA_START=32 /DNA_END=1327 /DNA_ORIENTATION=+